jgi:hypothetical protein
VKRAVKSIMEKVDRASRKIPIDESDAVGGGADEGDPPLPPLPSTPLRQQDYHGIGLTPWTTNVSLATSINITGRRCFADSSVLEYSLEEFEDNFEDSDYLGDEDESEGEVE